MACGDSLVFVSVSDGAESGRCSAGGAIKAAPVCDPWAGAAWVASHGRRLTVCEPPGAAQIDLDAQRSLPGTLSNALYSCRRRAMNLCVAGGELRALRLEPSSSASG